MLYLYYSSMATVLITGGTGMVGTALTKAATAKGYHVIILTRNAAGAKASTPNTTFAQWDVAAGTIDAAAVQAADFIVHLAGANVAEGRWTESRKKEIVDSRTQSSALLVKALQDNNNKVQAVISASAIGWYGADPQVPNPKPFTEEAPADGAFLGHTCKLWEESIQPVSELGRRLAILRIGIVLSNEGGAFKEFKKPLQFGVASVLGSGKQIISWIHIDDLVGLFIHAIENKSMAGIYNAVAPNPVSNAAMIKEIGKDKLFKIPMHVPEKALELILGEMSIEVLKSATVSAQKIERTGYPFLFPHITTAVKNLNKKASA